MPATSRRSVDRQRTPHIAVQRELVKVSDRRWVQSKALIATAIYDYRQKGGRSRARWLKSKAYRLAVAAREAADAATAREASVKRIATLKAMDAVLPGQLTDPSDGQRGTRGRSWQFSPRKQKRNVWLAAELARMGVTDDDFTPTARLKIVI